MSKMLLLEDDPFHLEFLATTISETSLKSNELVMLTTGEDAIARVRQDKFDCAVLDLQLPTKNGIEVAKTIWTNNASTPIVFWSNYGDASYVRAIVKIVPEGTNFGYILKTTSKERLKRALLGVLEDGQRIIDSEIRGILREGNTKSEDLSETEYETLNFVALGLTDKAISQIQRVSLRTVQNIIQSVHDKVTSRTGEYIEDATLVNRRCRTVSDALLVGLINVSSLEHYKSKISQQTNSDL